MNTNEKNKLKLGDYVKRSNEVQSDEYFMITALGPVCKLRKVGTREIIKTDDLEAFVKVDTSRTK